MCSRWKLFKLKQTWEEKGGRGLNKGYLDLIGWMMMNVGGFGWLFPPPLNMPNVKMASTHIIPALLPHQFFSSSIFIFSSQFASKSFPHRCSRILVNLLLLRIVGRWWTAWICVVCGWLLLGENYGLALAAGCTAADRWRRATNWIGGQISRNGGRCAISGRRGEWREHIAWTLIQN